MSTQSPPGTDLGYRYYPEAYEGSPGYPRLDILLRAAPTGRHFDPVEVRVLVVGAHGLEHLLVHRAWHGTEAPFHICADRVILRDYQGKVEEAFTFGGEMRIISGEDLTFCSLTSPAPILPVEMKDDIPTILAEDVEVLIARRRAEQLQHLSIFEHRLAEVDPAVLYAACLAALHDKYHHQSPTDHPHALEFSHFLHTEIARFQEHGQWPVDVPSLADLI